MWVLGRISDLPTTGLPTVDYKLMPMVCLLQGTFARDTDSVFRLILDGASAMCDASDCKLNTKRASVQGRISKWTEAMKAIFLAKAR